MEVYFPWQRILMPDPMVKIIRYFDGNSNIKLWGCNTANGDNNIASAIGEQTGNNVTGAASGTYFSSTPDGPYDPNFSARDGTNDPVYLVPHGEWDTVIYSPMEK